MIECCHIDCARFSDVGHVYQLYGLLAHNGLQVRIEHPDCCAMPKFENGDLINVQITATAKLELTSESGFISGEDTLPGCHLKPYDYEDPESHEVKVRVIELLEFNGIMDSAIERLGENIRATLSKMGVDEIDIAV